MSMRKRLPPIIEPRMFLPESTRSRVGSGQVTPSGVTPTITQLPPLRTDENASWQVPGVPMHSKA